MATIEEMQVKLSLDVASLKAEVAAAQAQIAGLGQKVSDQKAHVEGLSSKFKELGRTLVEVFAVAEVINWGKESVKMASEANTAFAALNVTLKNVTGATTEQTTAVREQLDKMALLSNMQGEALAPTFAKLVQTTQDTSKAFSVLSLAQDLAATKHVDVATAANALNKALTGQMGALSRLAPETKNAKDAFGLLAQETKGAAEAAGNADPYAKLHVIMQNIQETVGTALLPVLQKFADWLVKVSPKIQEFFKQLSDPTTKVGKQFKDLTDIFIAAFDWLTKNWTLVKNLAIALGVLATAAKTAAIAQGILDVAMNANPIGLVTVAVIGLTTALAGLYTLISTHAGEGQAKINSAAYAAGQKAYDKALKDPSLYDQTPTGPVLKTGAAVTLAKAREDAIQNYLKTHKVKSATAAKTATEDAASGVSTWLPPVVDKAAGAAAKAAAKHKEAVAKFTDIMKQEQAKAVAAQNDYVAKSEAAYSDYYAKISDINNTFNDAVNTATAQRDADMENLQKSHAANLLQIQRDYSAKLQSIVQQSMDLMRNAFASATSIDVGAMFASTMGSTNSLASVITSQVKNGLSVAVSWWGSASASGGGVGGLLKAMQEKLSASKTLSDNAAKLAGAGFSQNFIDQVISQGTDVGNQMAKAILDAAPDTQKALQSTFADAEAVTAHGVDSLAQKLYDTQGLATESLKNLYTKTLEDQAAALEAENENFLTEQKKITDAFNTAIDKATKARNDAISAATQALDDALSAAETSLNKTLDAIEAKIEATVKKMGNLNPKATSAATGAVSDASIMGAVGLYGSGVASNANASFGSNTPWAQAATVYSPTISVKAETNATPQSIADATANAIKLGMVVGVSTTGRMIGL